MPTTPPDPTPPALDGRAGLALLAFALLVYLATRVVGLSAFPIYFFCDEAIQANLADDLLHNRLRDADGTLLPPYFRNDDKWSLSASVYAQLPAVALAGRSLFATRLTAVLVGTLGALAIALTLRAVFRLRLWWAGVLVLAALPAWFLHARTAFETVMMVAGYAGFLCGYLLYRCRAPGWLPLALVCGAATFYSYANGQGVMLVSGVLLLLLDLPYHRRQWRVIAACLPLAALLAVPYVRFQLLHPAAAAEHLRVLDSYWLQPLPLADKLHRFAQLYLYGLSPTYWFLPNPTDLARHRMDGMAHLPPVLLPFWAVGMAVCARRWRAPQYRTVFVAMLAAGFSAALVGILVTRTLAMVVPATLLITLGIEQVAGWARRWVSERALAVGIALGLAAMSVRLLVAALTAGPTWSTDYGLYGMQYGGPQVFAALGADLAAAPARHAVVSPTWANNPQALAQFFLAPELRSRVRLTGIDAFMLRRQPIAADELFVLRAAEYEAARQSGKFIVDPPQRLLRYPDGTPGFYFVRLRYVDDIDARLAADRAARGALVAGSVLLDGEPVLLSHSRLDRGAPADLFDRDPATLIRGLEANPFVLQLDFAAPRMVGGVRLRTATMRFRLVVTATPADGGPPQVVEQSFTDLAPDPQVELRLPAGAAPLRTLRIEIAQLDAVDPVHVHVRELHLE